MSVSLHHSVEPIPLASLRVPRLGSGEVHLWHARLSDVGEDCFEECLATLDTSERNRAERYHFEEDRRQFVASRGLLRLMLSQYVGLPPDDLNLGSGEFGKPFLKSWRPLFFNVSHSWNHLLFGFSRDGEIGVDVEELNLHGNRLAELSPTICSAREEKWIGKLSRPEAESALTRLWTAKESFLKAVGTGLHHTPRQIEVGHDVLSGGKEAIRIRRSDRAEEDREATLYPLPESEKRFGCSAALCTLEQG